MLGFHVCFGEDCIYLKASIRSCNSVTAKVEISLVSCIFVVREERGSKMNGAVTLEAVIAAVAESGCSECDHL